MNKEYFVKTIPQSSMFMTALHVPWVVIGRVSMVSHYITLFDFTEGWEVVLQTTYTNEENDLQFYKLYTYEQRSSVGGKTYSVLF